MKVKELIRQLHMLDPSGECQVFADADIHFLERLPWYYDGKPGILLRNHNEKNFNITGLRQITEADGDKIYIKTLDINDLCCSGEECQVIGDSSFTKKAAESKQHWKEVQDKITQETFARFWEEQNIHGSAEEFWKTHHEILDRKDFDALDSSVNDKLRAFWKACIKSSTIGATIQAV